MRTHMIIDGDKLSKYLATTKVTKEEFLDYMREGEIIRTEYEDGECFGREIDLNLDKNLFKGKHALNYEQSKKLINALGADIAVKIIDWQAMGMENPSVSTHAYSWAELRLLSAVLGVKNERIRYAY